MATATQLTTFSDLYTDLQNRTREDTSQTATENQAKRYINIGLHDMHLGFAENFSWAERSAVLVTHDDYTTGTVAIDVSTSRTAVTGTSTAWDTLNDYGFKNVRAGGKIVFSGENNVYEVSAVGSDTALTLASQYVGADDLSGDSYTYYEDEYALASDYLRPIDMQQFSDGIPIELIGRTEFRRRFPRNNVPGTPCVGTIIDKPFASNTTPVRKIRLAHPPDDVYSIPYSYVTSNLAVQSDGTAATQLVNDTDEPIVPLRYRHAILFHALYHWYRDKKNDTRSQEVKAEYTDIMLRVAGDTEIGGRRPQIRPKIGTYVRRASRPWSGGGGRYDINDRFDRLEDMR